MAYLFLRERKSLSIAEFIEFRAYIVPKSIFFQEGIKYSMSYVKNGICILRYDNERGKGHHKHFMDLESATEFVDIDAQKDKFLHEVEIIRRGFYES